MNKEFISDRQCISIIILYICSNSLISAIGKDAKESIWIAIILAIVCACLVVCIYNRILTLYPHQDLFDILQKVFGTFIGKGISLLYIWYFFYILVIDLLDFMTFIITVGLVETPIIALMIPAMMTTSWGTKEGIEVLGRWAAFFVIILFIFVYVSVPFGIHLMDIDHLQPILYSGIDAVIKGGFSFFSFPFGEIVIFLAVFKTLKSKKSYFKVYILGLLLGGIVILSTVVTEMLVLGSDLYANSFFPSYAAITLVNIGGVIKGMQIIVSATVLIGGYTRSIVCLFASCKGISKLFDLNDYRFIVTPVAIFVIIIAISSFESINQMTDWKHNIYNYYAFLFQVIFPITIWIGAEIKNK
ncbi:GerAB/ArcD/ProY family transporter [Crassaminicella profunda]|uniref:GerAB/ArcD/ProY family transporter n=1 Tax=Crassaminicella profunda TaxID=1286698 RepID=UPI001CA714E3|nr:endospore germination permease [Crassaminicella profunda]QZY55003.1 endospore germination permease [Crassaminicella profunda]